MYVEFFGLPGCGKTTLAKALGKKSRKHSAMVPVISAKQLKLMKVIRTVPHYMLPFLFFITNCFKEIIKSPKEFKGFLIALFIRMYQFYNYDTELYFSDHGFIQTLAQNDAVRKRLLRDGRFFRAAFKLIPRKGARYLYVHCPLAKATIRMQRRNSQVFMLSQGVMQEHKALFDKISRKQLCFLRISANGPPRSVLTRVMKELKLQPTS